MVSQVMLMGPSELKKKWRVELDGEVADGTSDWFSTVVASLLDPNIGLWKSSARNDKVMEVNPVSRTYRGMSDHFVLFLPCRFSLLTKDRFADRRLMG